MKLMLSAPTRGPWIEISTGSRLLINPMGRPPHGGRGLKFPSQPTGQTLRMSAPTRGPWIEIRYGEMINQIFGGRPPHGGRGLKCRLTVLSIIMIGSAPTRGPWIEILHQYGCGARNESAPTRGPWIEMIVTINQEIVETSRPPHGGRGLKLAVPETPIRGLPVGPHTGAVD